MTLIPRNATICHALAATPAHAASFPITIARTEYFDFFEPLVKPVRQSFEIAKTHTSSKTGETS